MSGPLVALVSSCTLLQQAPIVVSGSSLVIAVSTFFFSFLFFSIKEERIATSACDP